MRINYDDDCNHDDYHDFGGCNAMVVESLRGVLLRLSCAMCRVRAETYCWAVLCPACYVTPAQCAQCAM